MYSAFGTYEGIRWLRRGLEEKLMERDHLENMDVDGWLVLKQI
jgi:hypothetical protein